MHLVYIDDSKDGGKHIAFSALCIPADQWEQALQHLIGMRRQMKHSDGIYTSVELHATDWLGGRGNVAPFAVARGVRARLFDFVLSAITRLPGAQLFNAFGPDYAEETLFERLLNRIQVNMRKAGSRAMLISDEGKHYDALLRRLRRHNYVRSRFGYWSGGASARNLPLNLIIEDLVYRDSARSFLIQAADFCAFSLLRNQLPTPRLKAVGIDQSFMILKPIMVTQAFAKDPLGIIRHT